MQIGCPFLSIQSGQPKGLIQILKDRGLYPRNGNGPDGKAFPVRCKLCKLKLLDDPGRFSRVDCCCLRMVECLPDFSAQKCLIAEAIEDAGHLVLFLPKFHPELNRTFPHLTEFMSFNAMCCVFFHSCSTKLNVDDQPPLNQPQQQSNDCGRSPNSSPAKTVASVSKRFANLSLKLWTVSSFARSAAFSANPHVSFHFISFSPTVAPCSWSTWRTRNRSNPTAGWGKMTSTSSLRSWNLVRPWASGRR